MMDTKVKLLELAIKLGNVAKAEHYAEMLAKDASSLFTISVKNNTEASSIEPNPCDNHLIKVVIEDKMLQSDPIFLSVTPETTVKQLKDNISDDHHFAVNRQRWIYNKMLMADDDVLVKKGVTLSSPCVYVYIASIEALPVEGRAYSQTGIYAPMTPGISAPRIPSTRQGSEAVGPLSLHSLMQEDAYGYVMPRPFDNYPVDPPLVEQIYESLDQPASIPPSVPVPRPPPPRPHKGWTCPACTYINQPTRPGCEICSTDRPADYRVPDNAEELVEREELERLRRDQESTRLLEEAFLLDTQRQRVETAQNYAALLQVEGSSLVVNSQTFTCPVCFSDVGVALGVTLRECLHEFCRECLAECVRTCDDAIVPCPFNDGVYICNATLTDREIKSLVSADVYNRYLNKGLAQAESAAPNSFHCKTVNCTGWCIYDDQVNFFDCPVCEESNCLTCKAIHKGMNCKQYQEDLQAKAKNDVDAQTTQQQMEALLTSGDAMRCPQCKILISKKDGCDWLKCTMCKVEICWVTKGHRWGPKGTGDTSGGCKCSATKMCHPNCQNCH